MSKGLKIVLPSAVSDPEGKLRKLEHYYGIEFVRGASDGGSSKGYYRLIGDDELRTEMRFHNQIKIANVKNGGINFIYDQSFQMLLSHMMVMLLTNSILMANVLTT